MTDKDPNDLTDDEIKDLAESPPAPDEYPPGQADELAENMNVEDPNGLEKGVVEMVAASEQATDSPAVRAFDKAVTAIQDSIESVEGPPATEEEAEWDMHLHDTTVIFGRELPYPIYTVVFLALGALTLIEVVIAELLINVEVVKIPILLGLATAKAMLVVIFYMHLNTDSRVFALTLAVSVGIALLALLFLISVPPTAGY
jgi:cytochrome c oxidase subunit 4